MVLLLGAVALHWRPLSGSLPHMPRALLARILLPQVSSRAQRQMMRHSALSCAICVSEVGGVDVVASEALCPMMRASLTMMTSAQPCTPRHTLQGRALLSAVAALHQRQLLPPVLHKLAQSVCTACRNLTILSLVHQLLPVRSQLLHALPRAAQRLKLVSQRRLQYA